MSLPVDLVSLVLYCVQQLGVVLGVGAQTVLLIAFILATRDGKIDQKEEQFGHVILSVLKYGLLFMVLSGILITVIHISFEQYAIVETPAFLFKWALIALIGTITLLIERRPFAHFFWEGILGAHWYALFIINAIAPLISWADLLVLYVLWSVGFMLAWSALVYSMRAKRNMPDVPHGKDLIPEPPIVVKTPPKPAVTPNPEKPIVAAKQNIFAQQVSPKPIATPPPPKPVVLVPYKPQELIAPPLPTIAETHAISTPPVLPVPPKPVAASIPVPKKPEMPIPEKPIEDPDKDPGLPTIRVMPQTPQDLDRQMRASRVQFE
jgi:hypothetical protein